MGAASSGRPCACARARRGGRGAPALALTLEGGAGASRLFQKKGQRRAGGEGKRGNADCSHSRVERHLTCGWWVAGRTTSRFSPVASHCVRDSNKPCCSRALDFDSFAPSIGGRPLDWAAARSRSPPVE